MRRKNRTAFLTERVPGCPWMKGPVFISVYLLFFLCQPSSDYSLGSVLNLPSPSIVQCSFSCAGLGHMWGKQNGVKSQTLRVAWKQASGKKLANLFIVGTAMYFTGFLSKQNVPHGIRPPGSYNGFPC